MPKKATNEKIFIQAQRSNFLEARPDYRGEGI